MFNENRSLTEQSIIIESVSTLNLIYYALCVMVNMVLIIGYEKTQDGFEGSCCKEESVNASPYISRNISCF